MSDGLNMGDVKLKQFVDLVKYSIEDGEYEPFLALGPAGIGKTQMLHQLAEEMGIGYKEMRLIHLSEIDLKGIPTLKEGEGGTRSSFASIEDLPYVDTDGETGVLVLDEITSANSAVRAACFQLLDSSRGIGKYKLPPKWIVVCLGNGPEDGGKYVGLESAFISRCESYRVNCNVEDWTKWAIQNGINKAVTAFVQNEPSFLHKLDPEAEDGVVFPCPRSWERLSKSLNRFEKRAKGLVKSREDIRVWASGTIGNEAASKFATFYMLQNDIVGADDILSGRKGIKDVDIKNKDAIYLTVYSITDKLRDMIDNYPDDGTNLLEGDMLNKVAAGFNFMLDLTEYQFDYGYMGIRNIGCIPRLRMAIITDNRGLGNKKNEVGIHTLCPKLIDFLNKNSHLFDQQ